MSAIQFLIIKQKMNIKETIKMSTNKYYIAIQKNNIKVQKNA